MYTRLITYTSLLILSLSVTACGETKPKEESAPSELAAHTGAHTRVVWVRAANPEGNTDTFLTGENLQLMGHDSHDGQGERTILDTVSNYRRPLLTPDGTGIVYSHHSQQKFYFVPWEGGEPRELGKGFALDVWADPNDGQVWVYAGTEVIEAGAQVSLRKVVRFPLESTDPTADAEPVWDSTLIALDNFQLSRDGKSFGGLFPWPHAGRGNLETGEWQKFGRGCWASYAPDDSGLLWIFDGPHKNVTVFLEGDPSADPKIEINPNPPEILRPDTIPEVTPNAADRKWMIPVNDTPELEVGEVYHPRWSNHPLHIAQSGPYTGDAGGSPSVFAGGEGVDIYLGRLTSVAGEVDQWFQLTNNDVADFCPDVWVSGGENVSLEPTFVRLGKPEGEPAYKTAITDWPGKAPDLLFSWDNNQAMNQVLVGDAKTSCSLDLKDLAVFGRNFELSLANGSAVAPSDIAAHVAAAIAESSEFSIEFVVNSYDFDQSGSPVLLTLGNSENGELLTLGQTKGLLSAGVRTTADTSLTQQIGKSETWFDFSKPIHLVLTYKDGKLSYYRNASAWNDYEFGGDLSNWGSSEGAYLRFGNSPEGDRDWAGRLEKVSIYSRALDQSEIDAKNTLLTALLTSRETVETVDLDAKVVAVSSVPTPESLGAYQRALSVYTYEKVEVHEGEFEPTQFRVAHWTVLDRTELKTFPREPGNQYHMKLEPFELHPEVKSERISDADEFSALPLFMDVSDPEMHFSDSDGTPLTESLITSWPGDASGLLFSWDNYETTNQVLIGDTETSCVLELKNLAVPGRDFDLSLANGSAVASSDIAAHITAAIAESSEFSIEFIANSSDFEQTGNPALLTMGNSENGELLTLGQSKGLLSAAVRTSTIDDLTPQTGSGETWFEWSKPTHLVVTFKDGKLSYYRDGFSDNQHEFKGDLSSWGSTEGAYLRIGNSPEGDRDWAGRIEKISIYNRALKKSEIDAKKNFLTALIADRKVVETVALDGNVIATSPVPSPESLGDSPRALSIYTYETINVKEGEFEPKQFRVAHWTVLDSTELKTFPRATNNQYFMKLEPIDLHPQIKSEYISDADESSTLPLYMDVSDPKMRFGNPDGVPLTESIITAWPGEATGLLFSWDNNETPNQVLIGDTETSCDLKLKDLAILGRDFDLSLANGSAVASSDIAAYITTAIAETSEFSIEFIANSYDFEQSGNPALLTMGNSENGEILTLGQSKGLLSAAVRTSANDDLTPQVGSGETWFEWSKPTHLVVTFKVGKLSYYRDGFYDNDHEFSGDLANWKSSEGAYLQFGNSPEGNRDWAGKLEKIAIYNRALEKSEIASKKNFLTALIADREAVETVALDGNVIASSPIPAPESLGDSSRALSIYTYETINVREGEFEPKQFRVAHWTVLDGTKLKTFPRATNNQYFMKLEPIDLHPQIKNEHLSDADKSSTLPLYMDVSDPKMSWE